MDLDIVINLYNIASQLTSKSNNKGVAHAQFLSEQVQMGVLNCYILVRLNHVHKSKTQDCY